MASGSSKSLSLASSASSGLASILPQVVALLLMPSEQYGVFALVYLIYALGVSVSLSSLSEAWVRTRDRDADDRGERAYFAFATALAGGFAVVASVTSFFVGLGAWMAMAFGLAVGAHVFRSGARFFEAAQGRLRRSVAGDVASILALALGWALGLGVPLAPLDAGVLAWAAAGTLACLVGSRPVPFGVRSISAWWAAHRREILVLQGESAIMDIGAIFTPMLLAPILLLADFGAYRAVSGIASPVRIVLNPLRPFLRARGLRGLVSPKLETVVLAASTLSSFCVYGVLYGLGVWGGSLGTLTALVPFAFPVAVYVAGNFLGHYHYLVARQFLGARVIYRQRLVQTLLVAVLPVAGALWLGLSGAIWGSAIATLVNGVLWYVSVAVAARSHRDP